MYLLKAYQEVSINCRCSLEKIIEKIEGKSVFVYRIQIITSSQGLQDASL